MLFDFQETWRGVTLSGYTYTEKTNTSFEEMNDEHWIYLESRRQQWRVTS